MDVETAALGCPPGKAQPICHHRLFLRCHRPLAPDRALHCSRLFSLSLPWKEFFQPLNRLELHLPRALPRQQQLPRFPVTFMRIPLRTLRILRQQRQSLLPLQPHQNLRRDQVPHVLRNHIRRKKVDLLQGIRLAVSVGLELAQIPILGPAIRRFHLHPQDPLPTLDAHIVSRRIPPTASTP